MQVYECSVSMPVFFNKYCHCICTQEDERLIPDRSLLHLQFSSDRLLALRRESRFKAQTLYSMADWPTSRNGPRFETKALQELHLKLLIQ